MKSIQEITTTKKYPKMKKLGKSDDEMHNYPWKPPPKRLRSDNGRTKKPPAKSTQNIIQLLNFNSITP